MHGTPSSRPGTAPRRARRTRVAGALALVVACGLLFGAATPTLPVTGNEALAATLELRPSERHRKVAHLVGEHIEHWHYRQLVLDDKISSQIFDHYLEALDPNRSYFLASDIADFERYRFRLGDAIRSGDVEPAFVIFARYQER